MSNPALRKIKFSAALIFVAAALGGLGAGAQNQNPAGPLDPSKLPDVVGIHLGMTVDQAKEVLRMQYPQYPIVVYGKTGIGVNQENGGIAEKVAADITEAPDPALVWHVGHRAVLQNIERGSLIATLRLKYGRETFDGHTDLREGQPPGQRHARLTERPLTNNEIQVMTWVFDEQGRPMPHPKLVDSTPYGCTGWGGEGNPVSGAYYESALNGGAQGIKGLCASLVVVNVEFVERGDVIDTVLTDAADLALVGRESKATYAWKQAHALRHQP